MVTISKREDLNKPRGIQGYNLFRGGVYVKDKNIKHKKL
jgi:hypothetical protein